MSPASPDHAHPIRPSIVRFCDVAVVGGSAAGLAAALQLVRQRRSVLVVDDATPRNAPAAHMHGYLGQEGAPPERFRATGREEVRQYGGEILRGRVLGTGRVDGRIRLDLSGGHTIHARRVVAATGIDDELPDVPGLAERWGRQVIHCPFCHGYEVRDQRLVQLVTSPMGLHATLLLRHLTDALTVVVQDGSGIDRARLDHLREGGVDVVEEPARRVADGPRGALSVELADGRSLAADAVLTGSRFRPRLEAFAGLGAEAAPHVSGLGEVLAVDATGRTGIDGLFGAGNVTDPSQQVVSAASHGALVGAQVAFDLAGEDLAAGDRPSSVSREWDERYAGAAAVWSANPNGTMVAETAGLPAGRALDVGAGEGEDALWLAAHGWTVTATDVSGNALARIRSNAERRGLQVRTLRADANALAPYGDETYDLVSLQYGSFRRTPDERGLRNILSAVGLGGTLLVVGHDPAPSHASTDPAAHTWMCDLEAYVGVADFAAAIERSDRWRIEVHETKPRPAGAVSGQHVDDVVLRAVRVRDGEPA